MKQSTKKKLRDIRNAFVMVCVMVAMLSTASYAWFTLTDSATVTNMQMTATTTGGLKVSPDAEDANFKTAVSLATKYADSQALKPVTLTGNSNGTPSFAEGRYEGNNVTGVRSNLADLEGYVAVFEYYIKSDTAENVNVGIICGDYADGTTMTITGEQADLPGSVVRQSATVDSATEEAPFAIRVGFEVDGKFVVWEPNNDGENAGTAAGNEYTATYSPNISSRKVGEITTGLNTVDALATKTSKPFFTANSTEKLIKMYVWLEGTDDHCMDQIKTDNIEAQIQFTIVDEALLTP